MFNIIGFIVHIVLSYKGGNNMFSMLAVHSTL